MHGSPCVVLEVDSLTLHRLKLSLNLIRRHKERHAEVEGRPFTKLRVYIDLTTMKVNYMLTDTQTKA